MIIHGNEIMEPEELAQLGAVFDEAWAAVSTTAVDSAEQRTTLASILLRLAHLRQLGPDQMKATAIRILSSESAEVFRSVSARPYCPTSLANEAADCCTSAAIPGPPLGA